MQCVIFCYSLKVQSEMFGSSLKGAIFNFLLFFKRCRLWFLVLR